MIDVVIEVVFGLLFRTRRKRFERPAKKAAPRLAGEKLIVVTGGEMHARAAEYRAWAEAHGLSASRGRADYAGVYRGVEMELVTGLFDTPLPRAVRLRLSGGISAHASSVEGVLRVDEAAGCITFDPFVTCATLDEALLLALPLPPANGYR